MRPETKRALIFIGPAMVYLLVVTLFPFIYTISASLYDWYLAGERSFCGIENYLNLMKDAAWLFIQWATSLPIQEKMGPLCTPSRLALWETEDYRKLKQQGWVNTAKWYVENGTVTEPLIPEFREVGEAMSVGFSKILKGEPAQASLSEAVAQVYKIMEKRKK